MSRIIAGSLLAVGLMGALACESEDAGTLTEVDATGTVRGIVWLDRNGNGILDGTDAPVDDVGVRLLPPRGGRTLYRASSTATGEFLLNDVAVGDYLAAVDSTTVGDTLRILRVDSASVTVPAGDTALVLVGLSYPNLPTDTVRALPAETRVFVEGRALNGWATFADSTLHVRDSTGAILAVRVPPVSVAPGDSIRLLGTTSTRSGQPVLRDVLVFLLQTGTESPPPVLATTGAAAIADDGALDADLVRVDSAVIQDTTRNSQGEMVLTIDDGTGPVGVVLDRHISFFLPFEGDVIGTILDVTGVLVPASTAGRWLVKPRGSADVAVGPLSYPTVPIITARQEPVGTRLIVEGRALNGWATFGDSTVHVRDTTGAIRAVRVPPSTLAAGDSLRVLGTTGTLNGQPVLRDVWMKILQTGTESPAADSVATATAATADEGRLDAGLLRIAGATIQDTSRTAEGDLVLTVDDGSGVLDVVLDRHVQFFLDFPKDSTGTTQVIGTKVDATGVSVSVPNPARWVLKPRKNADVVLR